MNEPTKQNAMLSPRKIAVQVIAWLIGLGLLVLVIHGAIGKGGGLEMWSRIRTAPPLLVLALIGCTLASVIFNGTTFWITVQPLRQVRWIDMNMLNAFAGMLNYAPVRVGAIARIAYHMRVDRLSLVQIGGWFGLVTYVLFLGVGATLLATLVRNNIDWLWLAMVLGQMIVGGAALRFVASIPMIARHARGLDQMAVHHRSLWGAVALRLLDLAAFTGRMAAASMILGMDLPWSQVVVLAIVALVTNLLPFGSLGFREFFVSLAAARLNMDAANTDAMFKQLALLDRAGEALVYIPLGMLALPWFRARWRSAARPVTPPLQAASTSTGV